MASLREYKEEIADYDLIYSTNGTCVALIDDEIDVPVLPVYHSTGFTIHQNIVEYKDQIEEAELWQKYQDEINTLELVPKDIFNNSLHNWGLCGKFMAQNVNNIVAVSETVKNELVEHASADVTKIDVVENGIEDFWFRDSPKCIECDMLTEKWRDKITVIWSGRTGRVNVDFKIKGLDRILEVYSRLPDNIFNKVVIALIPAEKKEYIEMYSNLFTKRGITFIPNCQYEHLPHLMQKGDIYIMPSRYEGFSLSLVEAMASKLAPISYRIGIAPDVIENKNNGYLVDNVEEMTEKIWYLADNPDIRQCVAENAFSSVQQRFSIDKMIDNYINIFNKITG